MGEARRKRDAAFDADACGVARPRDPGCPACRSRRIFDLPTQGLERFGVDVDWMGCRDCRAVWESFPPVYVRDPVCAEPCNNCAFRPGSPEQADKERWRELMRSLKPSESKSDSFGFSTGQFYCHKGIPIDMDKGPGNFLFPRKPVLMDGEPVRQGDGTPVMTEDTARMRICSGFLRMMWAQKSVTEESPDGHR